MSAEVIALRPRNARHRRPQEAKIYEAVEALIAEGQWPRHLSREQARNRIETWLLGPGGYTVVELPKLATFTRVLRDLERDEHQ